MHYHSQRDLYEDLDGGRGAERIQRKKEVQVSDVKAAAERVRRIRKGEPAEKVYRPKVAGMECGGFGQHVYRNWVSTDKNTLADAYLLEHPADDSEPITADWIKSVGFTIYGIVSDYNGGFAKEDLEWHERKTWRWRDRTLPKQPKTRFDLRRLADALGITLENKA